MIRNPDFDTFVCCAVCSKLIPPPPTAETFERIREYRPFKTRYYTHKDILDVGSDIKQQEVERREQEVQQQIEKIKAKLLFQAEREKEDAVDDALIHAAGLHKQDIEELKKKHEQEMQVAVMNTKKEMLKHLEVELKREAEAAEQRMTHKLHRLILQMSLEKETGVAKVREQERTKTAETLTKQQKHNMEQLRQAGKIANEIYQKNLQQVAWEKKHEMEIAFAISQKEYQEETDKLLKDVATVRESQMAEVETMVNQKQTEIFSLSQKLDYMTDWKNSLEAEISETREAFQKYIDVTFPQLAPGQADFILPFRKASPFSYADIESQNYGLSMDPAICSKHPDFPVNKAAAMIDRLLQEDGQKTFEVFLLLWASTRSTDGKVGTVYRTYAMWKAECLEPIHDLQQIRKVIV